MKLSRTFYERDTLTVAKELLGKVLVHKKDGIVYRGKIVETEAYLGKNDKACHTYGGKKTERLKTMYKEAGIAYVYLIYGRYNCFNITTVGEGIPEAVLIRGIEPLSDIDKIAKNRYNKSFRELNAYQKKNMTNGPGKLSMAFEIERYLDGYDLIGKDLYVEEGIKESFKIIEARRVGIDYAEEDKDCLYRFYIDNNPFVSMI